MNLYLSPETNDLEVSHDLNLKTTTNTVEELGQKLEVRLAFFQNEWFLNRDFGVPYYERILKKQADLIEVDFILRTIITTTPGVRRVLDFDSVYIGESRVYKVTFSVETTTGETLENLGVVL